MEWAVRAKGLTKRYGEFTAVDGIDLEVPLGVCFGILGPNGAGKTTTIRMITCRFPPDGGRLEVLGLDVTNDARRIKERFGLVPQENNLDEDLSLIENLELYGRFFGMPGKEARARSLELLDFMQLSGKRDEQVRALSGGMKRRAMIARALINGPHLLILDEPTTGLDPQARVLLWDRLRDLKQRGVTLLLTTHYMDEAERLCDQLVIMHEGRIIDQDTPRALVERHVGRWAAEVELSEGVESAAEALPSGLRRWELTGRILHLYADTSDVLQQTIRALPHTAYQIRPANLEDVFPVRTGREINE